MGEMSSNPNRKEKGMVDFLILKNSCELTFFHTKFRLHFKDSPEREQFCAVEGFAQP